MPDIPSLQLSISGSAPDMPSIQLAMNDYYLRIGNAADLKDKKQKFLYRALEILPGFLSLTTLFLVVFLSWKRPVFIAVFIVFFVIYWLLRTIYFSFHLRAGYRKMKEREKIDWLAKLEQPGLENWRKIYHLIVLTMHREPWEIVRQSFQCLAESDYPKNKMLVVLGCEEKTRKETEKTAEKIREEFGKVFFKLLIVWHPSDLPGEIAGKGSNETWAAKSARDLIINPLKIPYQDIIVSSFDADTCVFPKYFSCLTYDYLIVENPLKTSFQPIPLFINNIWQAPFFSRLFAFFSTFWQIICQERPEKLITFSSHSMSFQALSEVGFKQTNVVSDDSRIFWQCFLKYNGDYRVHPLYYPISMDANCAETFWKTIANIYKQQRRWAYGASEISYFLFGFLKNKKIALRKKIIFGFELIEGHWSWAVASILIFLLGWLPIVLGGPNFSQTIISYSLPKMLSRFLTVSMIGLVFSVYFSILLLPPKPFQYGRFKYLFFALSWLVLPTVMIFFTSLPALHAQIRLMLGRYLDFWPTKKVRKK